MLQATYKGSYTFYISTEDRRYDTDVPSTQIRYLFKFTNNMDGRVVYAYGQNQVVYDRYTKVTFSHNTTENIFSGRVNFVPNGYWNYKVYEVSSQSSIASLTCATAPQSANGVTASGKDTGNIGKYTVTNPSGTVTSTVELTGHNDVYEGQLSDLDAGTYTLKLYDGCDALVSTSGIVIDSFTAQSDDSRWLEIQNVDQTTTGITFNVVSNMPVGHSYDFQIGSGSYTEITNITSKPQTTSHSLAQVDPPRSAGNLVELRAYNSTGGNAGSGAVVWGAGKTIDLHPVEQPSGYYGICLSVLAMPVSVNSGGTVLSKGSAVITIVNGTTQESTTQGYYTLQGVVEQGKLYVSEPSGEEQVQYTQHTEPSGTNYIWYGQ